MGDMKTIAEKFVLDGKVIDCAPLGIGNINSTFLVTTENRKYTMQKLNTNIFKKPEQVMSNIVKVTSHLKEKIMAEGGDPSRETLTFAQTENGEHLYYEGEDVYRAYEFIDDVNTLQTSGNTEMAYKVAKTFGTFQRRLADFNADELYETIPDFHHTAKRFETFEEIIKKDPYGRAAEVKDLIDYAEKESYLANTITDALEKGILPLRVTHNDTKINNILFDKKTNEGLCVIDLDTVMPATTLYDFGDMVRSGAASTDEEDTNLDNVTIDIDYYRAFVKGFIDGVGDCLTKEEIERFALSSKVMTYECAIRFLGDHVNGDVYFNIRKPGHNMERAANLLKLLSEMERKYDQMLEIK